MEEMESGIETEEANKGTIETGQPVDVCEELFRECMQISVVDRTWANIK